MIMNELYITTDDGTMQKIGETMEFVPLEAIEKFTDAPICSLHTPEEFNMELPPAAAIRFIRAIFISLAKMRGYGRLAHLAKHAKKQRTRDKNIKRIYRTLTED
jgi:hypothetical protein